VQPAPTQSPNPWRLAIQWIVSALLLAFVYRATMVYQVVDQTKLALLAFGVSLPICVGVALIPRVRTALARTMRSDLRHLKSKAGRTALLTLLIAGWALTVVAGDYLLLATYNALGDHGAAVCRPMRVVKKSVSGGGGRSPIMKSFVVAPEAQPGKTIRVAVSAADYRQARANETQVELCVKPGALSMPWVSECRLARPSGRE